MTNIYKNLYQFTEMIEPIKLAIHQYLLLTNEPVLIGTGTIKQSQTMLPELKQILNGRKINYILSSHFESDECGGISAILSEFPEAITVCSELSSRQFYGFGLAQNLLVVRLGDKLAGKDFEIEFIAYPSEIHTENGIVFFEKKRGIFFSSDLMFRMGESHGQIIESTWDEQIACSGADRLPNEALQAKMTEDLKAISPKFIAAGHGPCVRL